jgi:hypothetical protein
MAQKFLKKLVIGFGFFNGFWFSLGISPEQEVIKFLQPILSDLHPLLKALFIILPSLLTMGAIISVIRIYHNGGLLGAGAVALAFLSGAIILQQPLIATAILIIAVLLGSLTVTK